MIELDDNEIRLSYQLSNRSAMPEFFVQTMRPLSRLQNGDKLVLPPATRNLLNGETGETGLRAGKFVFGSAVNHSVLI